jgi:hypothetical protein
MRRPLSRSKYSRAEASRLLYAAARFFAGALFLCWMAAPAGAHGFGQRYELPLPLTFYLWGAAATVAFSFVVVGLFVRRSRRLDTGARFDLLAHPMGRLLAHLALPLKLIVLVLFLATLYAGLFGNQDPYRNLAPTLVWIIGWVGLAYVSALFGDVWAVVNPWRTLFDAAERLWRQITGRPLALDRPYPRALGVWPAVALLLAFSWTELVYPTPAVPFHIACFALAYSAVTWTGMHLFGRDAWLRHGEVFGVVFSMIARLAPTEIKIGDRASGRPASWTLRPFGAGLVGEAASPSMTAFVLLLLSTVLYDGLLTTPEWTAFEHALLAPLAGLGEAGAMLARSLSLIAFWLLFLGAYRIACGLMSWAVAGRRSSAEIAHDFVFTLIPIAIGYHVAHYLLFLLVQGQYIVPLISDPFGSGWNLFGTAGYRPDIALVGARFAWYTAVGAVLLGHIVAVYLAHLRAMRVFDARAAVLRSQVPLTALMMVYTFVSLSILAEPIVQQREAALPSATPTIEIAIPADAVLPAPGSGRLDPVGPGKRARQKLTYRVLGSAFHDGTRTTGVDILYSYMFAFRWGVRTEAGTDYDPAVDAATAAMRRYITGLRAVGIDVSRSFRVGDVNFVREVLSIEVYSTVALGDPDRDATVLPPWSTLPWHAVVLMEEAVVGGWAAFSQVEAARRGVPWLDLVRSDELKQKLALLVAEFERTGYRPEQLESLVTADEARRRWAALNAFYKNQGHFLVTNGPYRLKQWSGDRATLEAFRDLSYPLGVGSYDAYAIPRRAFITEVVEKNGRFRISADIEVVRKFQRSYAIDRRPLPTIPPVERVRAAPECRYTVLDEQGRVVTAGVVRPGDDAAFDVNLEAKLSPGRYTMLAMITVNENAMNAEIRRIPVFVPDR